MTAMRGFLACEVWDDDDGMVKRVKSESCVTSSLSVMGKLVMASGRDLQSLAPRRKHELLCRSVRAKRESMRPVRSLRQGTERRHDPLYNHQLAASGHTCLNLYAVVSYAGLGPLVRIEGSVTPDQCVDIIDAVVVPHLLDGPFQDGSFVLQQDPSPTYTSETVTKHLEEQGILTMEWPPKSEDLNPMKGVWSRLGEPSADLLWAMVKKEWDKLRQVPDLVAGFYLSMPEQLKNNRASPPWSGHEDMNPMKGVCSIVKECICRKRFPEPSADLLWAMVKKEWDKLRHVPDRWLPDLVAGFYLLMPEQSKNVVFLNTAAL
ncbi:hypothetical protein HPB47_025713 [Ixodes persulcatus]|uniref:Uncharacterized protein n=1 Tax=Ixodes persulcatus TaxID=34615 RepID=A0AC60Q0P0_IXOPE|nr:hypothetical protein HPB47_025713 [Ixodes persulcatus]